MQATADFAYSHLGWLLFVRICLSLNIICEQPSLRINAPYEFEHFDPWIFHIFALQKLTK